jgi:HSP20 family protein
MGRLFERADETGPGGRIPAGETEEADHAYLVRAELPGMKRHDVNVELRGHELYITREAEQEEGGGGAVPSGQARSVPAYPGTPARRRSTPS